MSLFLSISRSLSLPFTSHHIFIIIIIIIIIINSKVTFSLSRRKCWATLPPACQKPEAMWGPPSNNAKQSQPHDGTVCLQKA